MRKSLAKDGKAHYLTHAMMYALETNPTRTQTNPNAPWETAWYYPYDSAEQVELYRKLYFECERPVRQYLDSKAVPPQGWAQLRDAVDKGTPDNIQISIKSGPEGPRVIGSPKQQGTTEPKIIVDPWGTKDKPSPSPSQQKPPSNPTTPTKPRPAIQPVPGDGPTGIELAKFGVSVTDRRNQIFVDKTLGAGKYKAGSRESNLALLAHFRKQDSQSKTALT